MRTPHEPTGAGRQPGRTDQRQVRPPRTTSRCDPGGRTGARKTIAFASNATALQERAGRGGPRSASGGGPKDRAGRGSVAGTLNRSTRIDNRSRGTQWNARSAGGAIVHFFGGASKPRFSLSGDGVFGTIRAVARTSGGTNAMVATRSNSVAARKRLPEGAMDIAGCKGEPGAAYQTTWDSTSSPAGVACAACTIVDVTLL